MDLLTMNRLLTSRPCSTSRPTPSTSSAPASHLATMLDLATDTIHQLRAENDALRDTLAAERADRDQERRETDAALSWGEAA